MFPLTLLERIPRALRAALLGVGVAAAFVLGWLLRDEHTATPELITGTVIWSNDDSRKIVVEVAGGDEGTREYFVAAQRWTDVDGTTHSGGYPSCLVAGPGDPVRTDRRLVAMGVVQLDLSDDQPPPLVVTLTCFR